MKEEFAPRKEKVHSLSREEKEEVYNFIDKQLRKEYIGLSKSNSNSVLYRKEK